ncbi:Lysophospholipase L1 [bacterium A37T11]|nr:Lysophospholipase L1 [bacterium A37T11]
MSLNNRRDFIKKAAWSGALAISIPEIVSTAFAAGNKGQRITLNTSDVVLFQGDSITDAGRNKEQTSYNNANILGSGYALVAGSQLLLKYADKNLKVYNKGISGNKVYQLAERWDADCLDIKPQVLSILVGVNDYWHTLTGKYNGTIKTYRDDFKALLDRTLKALPNVKLIIGEPYAVNGVKAVTDAWYPAFDGYRIAAKELATEYKAIFIPYQAVYDEAIKHAPAAYWTGDGVHPSLAGAALMAEAWLKSIN